MNANSRLPSSSSDLKVPIAWRGGGRKALFFPFEVDKTKKAL